MRQLHAISVPYHSIFQSTRIQFGLKYFIPYFPLLQLTCSGSSHLGGANTVTLPFFEDAAHAAQSATAPSLALSFAASLVPCPAPSKPCTQPCPLWP